MKQIDLTLYICSSDCYPIIPHGNDALRLSKSPNSYKIKLFTRILTVFLFQSMNLHLEKKQEPISWTSHLLVISISKLSVQKIVNILDKTFGIIGCFSSLPWNTTGRTIAPAPINFYTPFILLLYVSTMFSNCIHHPHPLLSPPSIFIITLTGSKLLNLNDVSSENMLSFIFPTENQCYTLVV